MKRHLCFAATVAALGLALVPSSACHAQAISDTAVGAVHMTAFSNYGSLTPIKSMMIWSGSAFVALPSTTFAVKAAPGSSATESGTVDAELKNNTGSSVTISNPSPTITVKAYGSTTRAGASADSHINLDTVLSDGDCSGASGTYSNPLGVGFTVVNLAPGDSVSRHGGWSGGANGG